MLEETGFLLVDKPSGMTSHDVIDQLRSVTGIKKIGHAGTLDPFATGLLIVAVSRGATKHIATFVGLDKTYEAEFVLGATTESFDPETEVFVDEQSPDIDELMIKEAIHSLTREMDQVPPMHSAVKVNGKKLYELAREGKTVERKPRRITIHDFILTRGPKTENGVHKISVKISCSSGTYIRAVVRDLAKALGTTGYVQTLRRTSIGKFDIKTATNLKEISSENWLKLLKSFDNMGIDV